MFIGVVASTMLLAGCGFLNNNSEKTSQSETQTASQKDKEKTQQDQNTKNEVQTSNETQKIIHLKTTKPSKVKVVQSTMCTKKTHENTMHKFG